MTRSGTSPASPASPFPRPNSKTTRDKLNGIFGLIEQMQAVDTTGVEPMSHPQEFATRLRPDIVTETDRRDAFQKVAPQTEAGLYLVPESHRMIRPRPRSRRCARPHRPRSAPRRQPARPK